MQTAISRLLGAKFGSCAGHACIAVDYVLVKKKHVSELLDKIEDIVEFINARPRPLAIYAFTNDAKLKKRIMSETSSGSVTFNNVIVQYIAETLPFGGVEGFGRYHEKFSFDTFSQEKAVMSRGFLPGMTTSFNSSKLPTGLTSLGLCSLFWV
ncbi:hypothetical protein QQ045_023218 [Rhodiola kirilowii]